MATEATTLATPASSLLFTDAAAAKVGELIREEANPNLKLRVFVQGGGCSGFQYGLNIEDEASEDDLIIEANGLRLFVDPFSMQYLGGVEIDYVTTFQGSGFTFNNPNASGGCGCGSSFTV